MREPLFLVYCPDLFISRMTHNCYYWFRIGSNILKAMCAQVAKTDLEEFVLMPR